MVTKAAFAAAAKQAVRNVIKHGDTDIFPLPFENHALFDKPDRVVNLVCEYDDNFDDYLARFPPTNVNSLTPVSYFGFRWATQIDPIWNAHLLSSVLALAEKIEAARIPKEQRSVFSYRYLPDDVSGDLFDRDFGWRQFIEKSIECSKEYDYVVSCDISEFYPRLGHHRLENALKQVAGDTAYPAKIMQFLANFSNTRSFGLPIGGPAARVLSELTINQIDRLLMGAGVTFTRFSDDFHLFAKSREDAYRFVVLLSEKLFENQGLSLQKSKTRIMTAAEFRSTNPLQFNREDDKPEQEGEAAAIAHKSSSELLQFSLRFDPYSATAEDDYAKLKEGIRQFDILGLLKQELAKTRVHVALSRKLVSAIRYLEGKTRDDAVLSILENSSVLYPIYASVLLMIDQIFDELDDEIRNKIVAAIVDLISSESHILRVDVILSFAIRVIQHKNTIENQLVLEKLYESRTSPIVRRDIILVMARWGVWPWLSDLKNRFRQLSALEKRAFLVASYVLRDEGDHWRKHIKKELNPFDGFILEWAGERVGQGKRSFQL